MNERVNRVLVVDRHPLMRSCISNIISGERDLELCGDADGMSLALKKIRIVKPDLVIIDLSLADGSGFDLIERIKAYDPDIRILIASMYDEFLYGERVMSAGAQGFVGKDVSVEILLQAIRQVLKGEIYLSDKLRDKIPDEAINSTSKTSGQYSIDRLSNRELTVFDLLGQGLSNRVIAEKLNLSVKTVEAHQTNIKKKLGFHSARDLMRHASLLFIHEDRYRKLFENMSQGVFYQRADGSLVDCNQALLDMFGLTREQFLGKNSRDPGWKVIKEDGSDLPGELHPSMQALNSGKSVHNVVVGVFNPQRKKFVWLNINAIPLFKLQEKKPYEVFVTLHDITERKEMAERLEYLSTHDPLTGLCNRMKLETQLAEEIHRAGRYNHPLSIYMLDIDYFKQVNDTYGHQAGDAVLKHLAKTLKQSVREEDLVARYGGEEFVVILPETSLSKAEIFAKRLFDEVINLGIPLANGNEINLSISIGIACYPDHAKSWMTLLESADKAMYGAKNGGRRQIRVA